MDEGPDRTIVHLQPALGELGHQPAQGEVFLLDPGQKPGTVLAGKRPRLVAADLARLDAAGLALPIHPPDRRTHTDAKLRRSPVTGQPAPLNRRNHPLSKIKAIGSRHEILASSQPAS